MNRSGDVVGDPTLVCMYRRLPSTFISVPTRFDLDFERSRRMPLPCDCCRWPLFSFLFAPLVLFARWASALMRDIAKSAEDLSAVIEEDEHDTAADARLEAETRR